MNKQSEETDFARRIRSVLDQGATNVSDKVAVRLYEARCDALRHHAAPVAAMSLAGFGHIFGETFHKHYRGILALVTLAIGALGVQIWQNGQEADELAEIDSELLSDEVPPSAYTDQGFLEWLRHLSESEQESLAE
jgi:hypothetical protein